MKEGKSGQGLAVTCGGARAHGGSPLPSSGPAQSSCYCIVLVRIKSAIAAELRNTFKNGEYDF